MLSLTSCDLPRCRPFEWLGCEPEGNVFTSELACQIQCEDILPLFPVYPPLRLSGRSGPNHGEDGREGDTAYDGHWQRLGVGHHVD